MTDIKFGDIIYQEEYDSAIKNFLLGMYVDELQKTHKITSLVYMPQEGKWLVKLEKDRIREMMNE